MSFWSGLKNFNNKYNGFAGLGMGKSIFENRTFLGGAVGGIYGAASDDTSFIGGALGGAGLARYGGRFGMSGFKAFQHSTGAMSSRLMGAVGGAGRGAFRQFYADGRDSAKYLAKTATRAYNRIKGLGSRPGN